MTTFSFANIGIIHSPWKEKFAVPRQPGLIQDAGGELHLQPPYNQAETVRDLLAFSHLWLLFVFHQTMDHGWQPMVRPPRLGGNRRTGVFASRSPFRPNPVGLSLVELLGIQFEKKTVILQLGSLDLVDGTPVIDIKPYLPYAEALPDARAGFAEQAPAAGMSVNFTPAARQQIAQQEHRFPHLERLITQALAQDPRPAYHKNHPRPREYAAWLLAFNIRWRVTAAGTEVVAVEPR